MFYNRRRLAEILQSEVAGNVDLDYAISDILIDSRRMISAGGAVFFAIRTRKNDGHKYIANLYKRGVRNFVVNKNFSDYNSFPKASFFKVENTLDALQSLAVWHRQQFNISVVGITGSNGKTVVKEWLFQLLNSDKKIVRSPKSYNSQIGVPLSVWQMNETHNLAIFEAGISEPEEMQKLQKIINPEIGIFTNIGQAHDENFINTAQKTGEKLNLFKKVKVLIYNSDNKDVHGAVIRSGILENITTFCWGKSDENDLILEDVFYSSEGAEISAVFNNENLKIHIPFADYASVENAMHCWALMLYLGYDNSFIANKMRNLTRVAMRLELKEGVNNCTLINDAYNSDVNSLAIAIDTMNQQNQHREKVLILSDIMQSGQNSIDLYTSVAKMVKDKGVDKLIGIGNELCNQSDKFDVDAVFFGSTNEFISNYSFANFANQTILLKGARKFEFERLSRILQQKAHETVMEINLDKLVNNIDAYRRVITPKTKIMAMVKAFSYGSGSFEIANVLQYHNVDYLAVAYVDEGIELRKAGINLPVMVMNPEEQAFDLMIRHQLEPEIYSFRSLAQLEKTIRRTALPQNKPVKVHIKIDTGMHRLGFVTNEVPELVKRLKANSLIYVQSVFSHLAGSDKPEFDDFTRSQIAVLNAVKDQFTQVADHKILFHIANSSGIGRFPESHMDMVRVGIGMYGLEQNIEGLENVISLRSILTQIKTVKKGESVGYNRSWVAGRDTEVGIVSIGYADGLLRSLGNGKLNLVVNGSKVPVIGDICMDMCMVDLTGTESKENDNVIVFNADYTVNRLAEAAGTIPYEIISRISQRVKRIYFHE